jgi:hypothetical protein
LAYAQYRLTTGIPEGINNKIKVIKRVAYGFRSDECFFLRFRHTFPGGRRCPPFPSSLRILQHPAWTISLVLT